MFENFDFKPGIVTYNPYNLSPKDITDLTWMNEDMLQVEYPEGYLIDVGWYGKAYTLNGVFRIFIVKDEEWGKPIFKEEYRSLTEIYKGMEIAVRMIRERIAAAPSDF